MAIITVSRQLGSHGSEIAAGVAEALRLRFIDREIIHRAAREAGVPRMALQELEYEGRRSLIERILNIMRTMPSIPSTPQASLREISSPMVVPFGGILTPAMPPFAVAMEDYVRMVEMVIQNLAQSGDVLILGRAGQMILKDVPRALHVQIIAPFPHRVEVVMERENVPRRAAEERVAASDGARAEYLRRYYNVDWLDPRLYGLVINTGKIPVETAVKLIVAAQQAVEG